MLEPHKDLKVPIVIEAEANKKQEYKLFGSFIIRNNEKIYSYDITKEDKNRIQEVVINRRVSINMDMKKVTQSKTTINMNLLYTPAYNVAHAKKRFEKILKKLDIK